MKNLILPVGPKFGLQNFFFKMCLCQSLDTMVSYDHVQYQKLLMIRSWENLVTDGQVDRETDWREWFHRTLSDRCRASKRLLNILLCCSLKKRNHFIMRISRIIEKIILRRSCYSMLTLYEFKLLSKYSSFYLWLFSLAVAATHLHSNKLFFNFKRERFCLQSLHIHINIYFDPICRDDTITWKKFIPGRRDSLFVKATSQQWKTSHQSETK